MPVEPITGGLFWSVGNDPAFTPIRLDSGRARLRNCVGELTGAYGELTDADSKAAKSAAEWALAAI
jgi:hypothetical protein